MSENQFKCGSCRPDDGTRLAPGSGLFVAAGIGVGGMMLAVAVFLSGAGLGWTLLTWVAAGPCGLALTALPGIAQRRATPPDCATARCRFRGHGPIFGRLANV